MTRSAPICLAASTAQRPTAPSPTTATVLPGPASAAAGHEVAHPAGAFEPEILRHEHALPGGRQLAASAGVDVEYSHRGELVDCLAQLGRVALELLALPELQPFEAVRRGEPVDEGGEVVDESLILGPMQGEVALDSLERPFQVLGLGALHPVDAEAVPRGEVPFADGEEAERLDELDVEQLLRGGRAARGRPSAVGV